MEVANDDEGTTNKERPKRSIQHPLHFKDFQLYMIKPKLKSFTDQEQLSLFFVVILQWGIFNTGHSILRLTDLEGLWVALYKSVLINLMELWPCK